MQNGDQATLANINKLYTQILERIAVSDQQMYEAILRAFCWILCALEPLHLEALLQAISFAEDGSSYEMNQSEFLSSCANLLCVDTTLGVVQFAHASVKDYLGTLSKFDLHHAHGVAASSCIDICNLSGSTDLTSGIQPGQSISLYAAMYWACHYGSAGTIVQNLSLDQKLIEFFFVEGENSLCFEMWVDLVDDISQILPRHHALTKQLNAIRSEPPTPLFAACIFGLESVLAVLLSSPSFNVDQRNNKGHTGLYLASAFGHDKLTSQLATNGADAKIVCGKFGNAFYAACANGNNGALGHLQKHLVPAQPEGFFETALQLSLRGGHIHTAEFLLKECIRIETQTDYDKLFNAASDLGSATILQYLQTQYPKHAASRPVSSKALNAAFRRGLLGQIQAYAKRTSLPTDSIAIAAYYGQNELLLFCIKQGLDVEEVGAFGSPLRAASLMGFVSTVRTLLDHGADVNNGGTFGDPLQAAAMHGHTLVAETLLQYGAKVNSSSGYYGSALQAAAYRGHNDVTELLISSGADIYQSGLFRDTFCAAVAAGQDNIIELLIRNGYSGSVPIPPSRARRSDTGTGTTERRLLAEKLLATTFAPSIPRSKNPIVPWERDTWNKRDNPCTSALLNAASSGSSCVATSIVKNWSRLRVDAATLARTLEIASENGHVKIVNIILQTVNIPGERIRGSLDRAAWHGKESVLGILLDHEDIRGQPHGSSPKLYSKKADPSGSLTEPLIKQCWADYLHPTTKSTHLNETYENGHIVRTLLQGCRGDQPSSVALALRLAPSFGLQNMLEASFHEAAAFDSARVLNYLMIVYGKDLLPLLPSGYEIAMMHGAISSVSFMMKHLQGAVPRTVQIPNLIEKAVESGNAEALRQFLSQTPHDQEPLRSGFCTAARHGHVHVLQVLFEHNAKFPSFEVKASLVEALHRAAAHGHSAVVEFLVQREVDVNEMKVSNIIPDATLGPFNHFRSSRMARAGRERPPRLGAVRAGAWDKRIPRSCVQACFDPVFTRFNTSVNVSDNRLHKSNIETSRVIQKQEGILEVLMRHGASIDVTDELGRSILHWAAITCSEKTVRDIVGRGSSIYACDNNGMSPLAYAAARELNSLCVFNALLEFHCTGEQNTPGPDYAQLLAAALGNFRGKPHGSFYESNSVYDVLKAGPGAVIRRLLSLVPQMEAVGDGFGLLLQMVAVCGDNDYLGLLIDRAIDVNAEGYYYGSALEAAARFGRLDCVRKLLHAGANVNHGGEHGRYMKREHSKCCSPLHAAILSGHLGVVRLILDAGVDLQLRDYSCVLEAACMSGSTAMVELLLSKASALGTQKTVVYGIPEDALTTACRAGSESIVELLLGRGDDPWNAILYYLGKQTWYGTDENPAETKVRVLACETRIVGLLLNAVTELSNKDFSVTLFYDDIIFDDTQVAIGNLLVRKLLGSHQFFSFSTHNSAFIRAWTEDEEFVLHVSALPITPSLLLQLSILGAQVSIDMVSDARIDDIHSTLGRGMNMSFEGE
jgi:ankyrin repeat protein